MDTSDLLKKVRKLEIKARGLSNQLFAGEYHSAFKGRGMLFSEVREYQDGDDVRHIDNNVSARFGHPFIKVYEEERELTVMLLVDISSSRLFGTKSISKKEKMAEICAILAFAAMNNNDKVGLILFSSQVEHVVPPGKGKKHVLRIIRDLIEFTRPTKAAISTRLYAIFGMRLKRKAADLLSAIFLRMILKKALKFLPENMIL